MFVAGGRSPTANSRRVFWDGYGATSPLWGGECSGFSSRRGIDAGMPFFLGKIERFALLVGFCRSIDPPRTKVGATCRAALAEGVPLGKRHLRISQRSNDRGSSPLARTTQRVNGRAGIPECVTRGARTRGRVGRPGVLQRLCLLVDSVQFASGGCWVYPGPDFGRVWS